MRSTRTQLCTAAEAVPAAGRSVNATAASAAPNLGRHTAPRRRLNVRHACTATCSAHPSNVATPSACAPAMAVAPINPTMYATTAADMTRLLNAGLAAGRRNSPLAESTPKHTPSGPNRSTAYVMARSMSAPSSCVGTCASPGGSAWTSAGARASVISAAGAVQSSTAAAAGCVTSTAGGACGVGVGGLGVGGLKGGAEWADSEAAGAAGAAAVVVCVDVWAWDVPRRVNGVGGAPRELLKSRARAGARWSGELVEGVGLQEPSPCDPPGVVFPAL